MSITDELYLTKQKFILKDFQMMLSLNGGNTNITQDWSTNMGWRKALLTEKPPLEVFFLNKLVWTWHTHFCMQKESAFPYHLYLTERAFIRMPLRDTCTYAFIQILCTCYIFPNSIWIVSTFLYIIFIKNLIHVMFLMFLICLSDQCIPGYTQ